MANIYEVAKRAGVSTATVSRVLSQPDMVTLDTRRKVMRAVDFLNYTPNSAAKNLRTLRTGKLLRVGIHSVLEFVRLRKSCACDLHLVDKRTLSLSGTSSRFSQGRAPGFLLLALRCRGKFDLE